MFAFNLIKDNLLFKKLGLQVDGKREKSTTTLLTSTVGKQPLVERGADVINVHHSGYVNKERCDGEYERGGYFNRPGRDNSDDRDLVGGDGYDGGPVGETSVAPLDRYERYSDKCISRSRTSVTPTSSVRLSSVPSSAPDASQVRQCTANGLDAALQVLNTHTGTTSVQNVSENAMCQCVGTTKVCSDDVFASPNADTHTLDSCAHHDSCGTIKNTENIDYQFTLTSPTSEASVTSDTGETSSSPTRPTTLRQHLYPGGVIPAGALTTPSSRSSTPDLFYDAPETLHQPQEPSPAHTPGSEVFQDVQEYHQTFDRIVAEVVEKVKSDGTIREDSGATIFLGPTQDNGRNESDSWPSQGESQGQENGLERTLKDCERQQTGLFTFQEKVEESNDTVASTQGAHGHHTNFTGPEEEVKRPTDNCKPAREETEVPDNTHTQQERSEDDQPVVDRETEADNRSSPFLSVFNSGKNDSDDESENPEQKEGFQSKWSEDVNNESDDSNYVVNPEQGTQHTQQSNDLAENQHQISGDGFSEVNIRKSEGQGGTESYVDVINKTSDKETNECCTEPADLENRNEVADVASDYPGEIRECGEGMIITATDNGITEETERHSHISNFEEQQDEGDNERMKVTTISLAKCEENERTDQVTSTLMQCEVRDDVELLGSSVTMLCKETEDKNLIKDAQFEHGKKTDRLQNLNEEMNSFSNYDQCCSEGAGLQKNDVEQLEQNENMILENNSFALYITNGAIGHDSQFVSTQQQTLDSPTIGMPESVEECQPARHSHLPITHSDVSTSASDLWSITSEGSDDCRHVPALGRATGHLDVVTDTATPPATPHHHSSSEQPLGWMTYDQINTCHTTPNSLPDYQIAQEGFTTPELAEAQLKDHGQSQPPNYTPRANGCQENNNPSCESSRAATDENKKRFSSFPSPHCQLTKISPDPSFGSSADCHTQTKRSSNASHLKDYNKEICPQMPPISRLQAKFLHAAEQEQLSQHQQQEETAPESLLREETRRIVQMLANDKACKVPRPSLGLQDRLQSLMQRSTTKKTSYVRRPRFCSSLVKNIVKHTFERLEAHTDSFQAFVKTHRGQQSPQESSVNFFPCNDTYVCDVSKSADNMTCAGETTADKLPSSNNMNVENTVVSTADQDVNGKSPSDVNKIISDGIIVQNTAVSPSDTVNNATENNAENNICTSVSDDNEKHSQFKTNNLCTNEKTLMELCDEAEVELPLEGKDNFDKLVIKMKWDNNTAEYVNKTPPVNMSEELPLFTSGSADTGDALKTCSDTSNLPPRRDSNNLDLTTDFSPSSHLVQPGLDDKMGNSNTSHSPSAEDDNKADVPIHSTLTSQPCQQNIPDVIESSGTNSDTVTHPPTHPPTSGTADELAGSRTTPSSPELPAASHKKKSYSQRFPQRPKETNSNRVDLQAHIASLNRVSLKLVSKVSVARLCATTNKRVTEATAPSQINNTNSVRGFQATAHETKVRKLKEEKTTDNLNRNIGLHTETSRGLERKSADTRVMEDLTSSSRAASLTGQQRFCQESITKLKTDNLVNRCRGVRPKLHSITLTPQPLKPRVDSVSIPTESTKPQQTPLSASPDEIQPQENPPSQAPPPHSPGRNNITKSRQGSITMSRQSSTESRPPIPPSSRQGSIDNHKHTNQRKHSRSSSIVRHESCGDLRAFQQDVKRSRTGSHHIISRRGSRDPSSYYPDRRRGSSVVCQSHQPDNRRGSVLRQSCSRRGSKANFSEDLLRKCLEVAVDKCDSMEWEETVTAEPQPPAESVLSQEELDRSLKNAVCCRDAEQVRTLLNLGADPNVTCGHSPALLRAAKDGALYVVQALLAAGADADVRSDQGNSPLHVAARGGYNEMAIQLVHSGAHIDAINRSGITPIQMALAYGQQEIARTLVRLNADLFLPNKVGETAYDLANELGYMGICAAPREVRRDSAPGTRIEPPSTEIPVAVKMIQGIEEGCPATVEECLAKGASANTVVPLALHWPARATVLHRAAHHGHDLIVRLLLFAGGDVNKQDFVGNTPLHAAAQAGHNRVVKLLLGHGASLEATSQSGITPLHRAAAKGKELTCNLLLRRGADAQATDRAGRTPGDWARKRGFKNLARKLVYRRRNTAALLAENDGYQQQLHKLNQLHQAALNAAQQEVCMDCEE